MGRRADSLSAESVACLFSRYPGLLYQANGHPLLPGLASVTAEETTCRSVRSR